MKRTKITSVMFALGIAGTMGFGATQALAAPGEIARTDGCYTVCEWACGPAGGLPVRDGTMCLCCTDGGPE